MLVFYSNKGKYSNVKCTFILQVKKWNAVALWAWDILVDNCAICRNHIMDLCIECQANQASHTSDVSNQLYVVNCPCIVMLVYKISNFNLS